MGEKYLMLWNESETENPQTPTHSRKIINSDDSKDSKHKFLLQSA